jgi:hypothetical protein
MTSNTLIGILGALLVLFGFYRTSLGKWTGKSLWYELDNFAGATLLVIYQFRVGAYVSVVVNIIWAIVALIGVTSIAQRRNWKIRRGRK